MPELDLDGDEQLAADLVAPRYWLDSQGRRVVEPKADTKKRLGRSPDRGDAVVMACCVAASSGLQPGWGSDDEPALSRRRRGRSPLAAEYDRAWRGIEPGMSL
jgi:hypothetical protein